MIDKHDSTINDAGVRTIRVYVLIRCSIEIVGQHNEFIKVAGCVPKVRTIYSFYKNQNRLEIRISYVFDNRRLPSCSLY